MPLGPTTKSEVAQLATCFNETLGFYPNSVLTIKHRLAIATAFSELNKAVMANYGRITSALKRLTGYLSSHTAGCQYCQAHTILVAERYGAAQAQFDHIWEFATNPAFNAVERAALAFAVGTSAVPNAVNEALGDALRTHWNEGEIVEILGVMSLFGLLNRWNDSMMGTILEAGAVAAGHQHLAVQGWSPGKHA